MASFRLSSGLKQISALSTTRFASSQQQALPRQLCRSSFHTFPKTRTGLMKSRKCHFQHSQIRTLTHDIPSRPKPWRRAVDMSLGALTLLGTVSLGSLWYFYSGHVVLEKVPLTNRPRFLWADREFDEELGHPIEGWLMSQREKPRLREDDAVAIMVRSIMKRLLEVDLAKGLEVKLYMFDDFAEPNAWGGPAQHGGRIFINTGCVQACKNPEEVAAVLAHELGHVLARHVLEQNLKKAFAQHIVRYFGFKGDIGTDLISMRVQEAEADHMGLLIMAQAGFDPEKRLSYLKDRLEEETRWLGGREPLPEFLSTHPSSETRIALAERVMPEARRLFEKKGSIAVEITGWEEVKMQLDEAYSQYVDKCAENERLAPDVLLKAIDGKLNSLIEVWNNLVDIQRSAVEEALKSKVLEEAVKEVVSQKEARAQIQSMESQDEEEARPADEDEGYAGGIEVSFGPMVREAKSIALAPPPMVSSPMAPGTEGSCVIPQPEDAAVVQENVNMPETERESSPKD